MQKTPTSLDMTHPSNDLFNEPQPLTWSEIRELITDLPDQPCERFNALLPLYLDELCALEVREELSEHQRSCQACQESQQQLKMFNAHLIESFEALEPTVSRAEAEESLRHLLTERWDELGLEELGLDELRQEVLNHEGESQLESLERPSPRLIIEGPQPRQKRSRRRVISAVFSVAAAAILFAYGPNLIETDVSEQVARFPDASQVASTFTQPERAPLQRYQGRALSDADIKGLSGSLTLEGVKRAPTPDQLSTHFIYQVNVGGDLREVDLWIWKLNSEQQREASATIARNVEAHEAMTVGDHEIKMLRTQPQASLQLIEYLNEGSRYQLSAPVGEGDALLSDMARLLLSESAQ